MMERSEDIVEMHLMAAQAAIEQGDSRRGHELLRQAAIRAPRDVRIWWALFRVVQTDDDRRTCLENILTITPNDHEAKHRLQRYVVDTTKQRGRPARRLLLHIVRLLMLLFGMAVLFTLGMAVGMLLNLL